MKLWLLLTLPLYLLDQGTKWLITQNIERNDYHTVIPNLFDLVYYTNTGAAFSIFTSANSNRLFIVISFVTLAALLVANVRGHFSERLGKVALAILIAGILGNLTDRLLRGHVVDFLLVRFGTLPIPPWPAFNVADSCICIAAGLFVLHSFKDSRQPSNA
jgi:signal peptidase II